MGKGREEELSEKGERRRARRVGKRKTEGEPGGEVWEGRGEKMENGEDGREAAELWRAGRGGASRGGRGLKGRERGVRRLAGREGRRLYWVKVKRGERPRSGEGKESAVSKSKLELSLVGRVPTPAHPRRSPVGGNCRDAPGCGFQEPVGDLEARLPLRWLRTLKIGGSSTEKDVSFLCGY